MWGNSRKSSSQHAGETRLSGTLASGSAVEPHPPDLLKLKLKPGIHNDRDSLSGLQSQIAKNPRHTVRFVFSEIPFEEAMRLIPSIAVQLASLDDSLLLDCLSTVRTEKEMAALWAEVLLVKASTSPQDAIRLALQAPPLAIAGSALVKALISLEGPSATLELMSSGLPYTFALNNLSAFKGISASELHRSLREAGASAWSIENEATFFKQLPPGAADSDTLLRTVAGQYSADAKAAGVIGRTLSMNSVDLARQWIELFPEGFKRRRLLSECLDANPNHRTALSAAFGLESTSATAAPIQEMAKLAYARNPDDLAHTFALIQTLDSPREKVTAARAMFGLMAQHRGPAEALIAAYSAEASHDFSILSEAALDSAFVALNGRELNSSETDKLKSALGDKVSGILEEINSRHAKQSSQ